MDEPREVPLEVPAPPRPKRLNRLAFVVVLVVLGVAVAAVFWTLAPRRQARIAAEAAEGPAPPHPGFLEHQPAATAPARRPAPAEAPQYWQDALREGRLPANEAGAAGGESGDPLAAGSEPGAGLQPGMPPGGERARTPAPGSRQEAYRRALQAPVTPARGAAATAEGGDGSGETMGERMARQLGLAAPFGLGTPPAVPLGLGTPPAVPLGLGTPPAVPAALLGAGAPGSALPDGAAATAAAAATSAVGGGAGATASGREHQGFLRSAETLAPAELSVRRDRPGAGVRLEAGTVLPAALVTAVDSDVAGPLVAQVTQDVFDRDQRRVVIPRGSRLLGAYDHQVALGESRLLVAWGRVIFPDGSGLSFPGLPAATRSGEAGLPGSVNNHLARVFGSAVLLSILGAGVQLSQPQESATFGTAASTRQVAAAAVGQELSSVAIEMLRRQLSVPPTIRIAAGTRFYVFLRGDVRLEEPVQE
jgi:type IV secretory pathway VirB10-like protein